MVRYMLNLSMDSGSHILHEISVFLSESIRDFYRIQALFRNQDMAQPAAESDLLRQLF